MPHYRRTHPDLAHLVDVTVHERDGRYTAAADLAEDSRDVGAGDEGFISGNTLHASFDEECTGSRETWIITFDDVPA